jgi:hypothetical protein
VAAEGAPRGVECFCDAGRDVRVRHERQGERLIAGTLIDAAGQSLVAPLKNPEKKST